MKMNIKVALKSIKNYFNRSISIIISMAIGVALIVGIGTLSKSAKQADVDRMKYEFGSFHVKYDDINKKQLESIKSHKNIEKIGLKTYYDSNVPDGDNMLNLVKINKQYLELDNTKLIKGKLPEKENEILLEPWVMLNLGLKPKLDEKLTINLAHEKKIVTYTVVGIVEDRVSAKSNGIQEIFLPLNGNYNEKTSAYVKLNETGNIHKSIDQIKEDANIKNDFVHKNKMLIDSLENSNIFDYKTICIISIISIFSIMVIYSIFNISILQRISEYGILKAIGANTYQVFKLVITELAILLFAGIPLGISLGILGAKLSSSTLGSLFVEGNISIDKIIVSMQSIVCSIIITVITIISISIFVSIRIKRLSPIDAIKKRLKHKKIKNLIQTNFLIRYISITKIVSLKNISRNKKCFYTTIISMTLGGTIFIVSNFGANLKKSDAELSLETYFKINSDYKIVQESMDVSSGLSEYQVKELKSLDGVQDLEPIQSLFMSMNINSDHIKYPHFFDEANNYEYNKNLFGGVFTKDKINGSYMVKGCLYGYKENNIKSLRSYLKEGKIDINKMENENTVLLRMPKDGRGNYVFDIKPGDKVNIKFPKDKLLTEKVIKFDNDVEYIEQEYVVGGIIEKTVAQNEFFVGEDGVDLVVSDKNFKEVSKIQNYSIVNINKKEDANTTKLNEAIYNISRATPGSAVRDLSKEVEDINSFANAKLIFINGITIILLLISLFNIINNISYNLVSRICEFSIIRAIGISNREFKQMIIFEGLIYGFVSSILTVVLSLIGQIILYKIVEPTLINPIWSVNYKLYICIVFVNILIGFVSTYLPSKKIKTKSIVESISSLE